MSHRARENVDDILIAKWLESINGAARKQRSIEREGGVFGGRANQRDAAILDMRQKSILLSAIEPMNLINEQERTFRARAPIRLGFPDDLPKLGHTTEHRGKGT